MPKYYKRKEDGLYETSKTINGKRVRFRGKTCAEVDRKIAEYDATKKSGRKFDELAEAWYEDYRDTVKLATQASTRAALKWANEIFKGKRMSDIRPLDIDRALQQMKRQGYAHNTVARNLGVIRMLCRYAVTMGDIDINPASDIRVPKGLPHSKRAALTEEEELAVQNYRGEWWLLGYMLLFTGCRIGELAALNWQDIDRRAGVIHITKKIDWVASPPIIEYHLKSENGKRDIPLLAPLAEALPNGPRIGPIFTQPNVKIISRKYLDDKWAEYRKAVGLRDEITHHCLRHSFATICFEAGINTKSFAAILGDTEEVANKIYAELRNRCHQSSVEQLNAYLEMRADKIREA